MRWAGKKKEKGSARNAELEPKCGRGPWAPACGRWTDRSKRDKILRVSLEHVILNMANNLRNKMSPITHLCFVEVMRENTGT